MTASRDRGSGSSHTFGLLVSRFAWDTEMGSDACGRSHRRAEAAGFRDIWVMDHFRQIRGVGRPWEDIPEAYTALAHMAAVTSSIRLGALVTGITHRHPIVLGKMVATLDVLSGWPGPLRARDRLGRGGAPVVRDRLPAGGDPL